MEVLTLGPHIFIGHPNSNENLEVKHSEVAKESPHK